MDRWVDSLSQHPIHALAPCGDAILSPFATSNVGRPRLYAEDDEQIEERLANFEAR